MNGVAETATAVVAFVAPFLPRLTGLAGNAAEKIADVVLEKGGEAALTKAKSLWDRITARFGGDPVITASATMVADAPDREDRRADLAEVLAKRLGSDLALLSELRDLLGGEQRVQEMAGGDRAVLDRVSQRMKGPGTQSFRVGNDGRISNGQQHME